MEIIVVDESLEWDELVLLLKNNGVFTDKSIDVSKLLRDDLSINLELFEIAIQHIVSVGDSIRLEGFSKYFEDRKILSNPPKMKEEFLFLTSFASSVAEEINDSDKELNIEWEDGLDL